MIEQRVRA